MKWNQKERERNKAGGNEGRKKEEKKERDLNLELTRKLFKMIELN